MKTKNSTDNIKKMLTDIIEICGFIEHYFKIYKLFIVNKNDLGEFNKNDPVIIDMLRIIQRSICIDICKLYDMDSKTSSFNSLVSQMEMLEDFRDVELNKLKNPSEIFKKILKKIIILRNNLFAHHHFGLELIEVSSVDNSKEIEMYESIIKHTKEKIEKLYHIIYKKAWVGFSYKKHSGGHLINIIKTYYKYEKELIDMEVGAES